MYLLFSEKYHNLPIIKYNSIFNIFIINLISLFVVGLLDNIKPHLDETKMQKKYQISVARDRLCLILNDIKVITPYLVSCILLIYSHITMGSFFNAM